MRRALLARGRRARAGRLPYSFVGIVILAAMVILTAYFELAITWTNNTGSYNVPEETTGALLLAQQDLSQAAYLDLMKAEAQLLVGGANPALNTLNATLGTLFYGSLSSLDLLPAQTGLVDGTVTMHATAWSIDVTWDEGEVADSIPQVSLQSGMSNPDLPLPSVADSARTSYLGNTEEPVYPMAIGSVTVVAVDTGSSLAVVQTLPFTETVQSSVGLLEDSTAAFGDAAQGPEGGMGQLVQYLTTTLGEIRALAGYGASGWPGPQAQTTVGDTTCTAGPPPLSPTAILSCDDMTDAVSLATLLESLQYFHSYDPNATYAFLSGLGPGPYQTLLSKYVYDGVVDGAALLLLLLNGTPGSWIDGTIASGAGLASAAYSFADRYRFDLYQKFFGTEVVDPTLTEPVVDWYTVSEQGQTWAEDQLTQWLTDYQNWLGITITSIPAHDDTATIPAETATAGGCTYTIFPGGTIEVSNLAIPDIADLVMGTPGGAEDPTLFELTEGVTINPTGVTGPWTDVGENAGYYVVDDSLLAEYDNNPILAPPGGIFPGSYTGYMEAVIQILQSLNASVDHKSPANTQILQKGLLDYLAYEADKDGANYTLTGAGLPDLNSLAGVAEALNSTSYNLLENGTNSLFSGPFALALEKLATQAGNQTWLNDTWIWGADHPNLQGADTPSANPTSWWTMTDIARLAARELFQAMYMLWYGSSGVIPTSPVGAISYNLMDAAQYQVNSPGVEHNPPPVFHEPDFAINVQNETYISVMNWMGWTAGGGQPECGGGFGRCGDSATGNNGAFSSCGGAPADDAAYALAVATYYTEEGKGQTSNTWNDVAGAVTCALLGPSAAGCAGAPYFTTGTADGLDSIHYDTAPGVGLGQSWWNVKNETGDGYWGCLSATVGICPTAAAGDDYVGEEYGNFTNWTIDTIAQPLLNDTKEMGETGGWLSQIYAKTQEAIGDGANQTAIVAKPYLENGVPYQFYQGSLASEQADQQIFSESLRNLTAGMTLEAAPSGLTFTWTEPTTTIHLVDPQNDASSMAIAPMESSYSIEVNGALSMRMISTRASLSENGYLYPTDLNVTIPVDVNVDSTIYTPWNLGSGWDALPTPIPGDPTPLQTRGLLGLEGHDAHASPDFLPGTYVSVPLNALLTNLSAVGGVAAAEGRDQANLLAALPDRGVGASAAWSQNLTLLENTTNTDLAATNGPFLTGVQADLATLRAQLTAVGAGYGDVAFTQPAYYGYAGQLNVLTDQFDYYGTPVPVFCGGAPCFGDPLQYNLTLTGPRVGVSYFDDNDFNAYPFDQGFSGSWGTAVGGDYTLRAYWTDFGTPYELRLDGGSVQIPPSELSTSSAYPSLDVPYDAPTAAYPAELSVSATGVLPAAASTAFDQAIGAYLPSPGVFPDYVTEQQYAAGYLYDGLPGAVTAGVTSFGYATDLEYSTAVGAARDANFSLTVQDPAGLFQSPTTTSPASAYLLWYEQNNEFLAYRLGGLSEDPSVLSSASPWLLANVYANESWATGDPAVPSTYAFFAPNLAFTEADLGGTGGYLLDTPTILIGGGTPGTWAMAGTLTTT